MGPPFLLRSRCRAASPGGAHKRGGGHDAASPNHARPRRLPVIRSLLVLPDRKRGWPMTATAHTTEPDVDQLLRANLLRVFNERDAAKRAIAMDELYVADPVMFEPTAVVEGRNNIADTAGQLLAQFGPDFTFVPDGPAVGHHGLAVLRWHAGPKGGPIAVTGADAAEIVDGRIAKLWVLLNAPAG